MGASCLPMRRPSRENCPDFNRSGLKQRGPIAGPGAGRRLQLATVTRRRCAGFCRKMLIPSVVARPLRGEPPTIDLMMGYVGMSQCAKNRKSQIYFRPNAPIRAT
jgi:hypothetical protein